jgi:hypothetical protein
LKIAYHRKPSLKARWYLGDVSCDDVLQVYIFVPRLLEDGQKRIANPVDLGVDSLLRNPWLADQVLGFECLFVHRLGNILVSALINDRMVVMNGTKLTETVREASQCAQPG